MFLFDQELTSDIRQHDVKKEVRILSGLISNKEKWRKRFIDFPNGKFPVREAGFHCFEILQLKNYQEPKQRS